MRTVQELTENYKNFLELAPELSLLSKQKYYYVIRSFLLGTNGNFCMNDVNKFLVERDSYMNRFAFKYFFKSINRKDLYDKVAKVKKKPRVKVFNYIPRDKLVYMINQLEPKFRYIAFLQFKTGIRFSEIATMRAENIDFNMDPKRIYIRIGVNKSLTKGEKERSISLPVKYETFLRNRIKKNIGYVFLDEKCELMEEKQLRTHLGNMNRYYNTALKKVGDESNVRPFSSHVLRHAFANEFLIAGGNAELLRETMGHSKIDTTLLYVSVSKALANKVLDKMEGSA
jgi:integrase